MAIKEIYLDNAATTRAFDEVGERVRDCLCERYGNPSSLHGKGLAAEHILKDSAEAIAKILKVDRQNIFFTSGGTESDNLALFGAAAARARSGHHIISSHIEHPAVQEPLRVLEERGYEVSYLKVDRFGLIDPGELAAAVRDDTILVSVMAVNNEIGAMQDLPALVKASKEKNPNLLFHTDAVQAFGKMQLYPKRMKIDLLSMSSHKIHGPKGVGALYVADPRLIRPILFGGGQQADLRPGTENVPGIAGFALAASMITEDMEEKDGRIRAMKRALAEGILSLGNTRIHAMDEELLTKDKEAALDDYAARGISSIVSASFRGVSAEVLLHALEDKGIYVSSGSACSSNHPKISDVLREIGADREDLESTIRFSLSDMTAEEEIGETVKALTELIPLLRRFTRK